jgi:hypothetical protein
MADTCLQVYEDWRKIVNAILLILYSRVAAFLAASSSPISFLSSGFIDYRFGPWDARGWSRDTFVIHTFSPRACAHHHPSPIAYIIHFLTMKLEVLLSNTPIDLVFLPAYSKSKSLSNTPIDRLD